MNEVTKIHLGRQAFTISVAAHKQLRAYIDAIEKQVQDRDVIDEVELRMAELLTERGITGEKVILVKDVDFLKEQLGNPADFKEEGDEEMPANTSVDGKKLFRDTDNAMIAGVAAGLSKYFGIDAILIRILFVLSALLWGWGILVYIVLWLLVPEAKTSSDRLRMAGKLVTVDSLKEVVERADVKGAARRANNTVAGPINAIFGFILKVIGIAFTAAGLAAVFGLIAGETYVLLHNGSFSQDNVFPVGFREHLLLDIGVAVAALISIFIILFGMAIFRRKWPIRTWITGILVGLIFIGAAAGGALAADVVPTVRDRYNANVHTITRPVQPFTSVNAFGDGFDLQYNPSDKYSVSINYYGNPNLSSLKTSVNNGVLTIDSSQFDWHRNCATLCLPDTYNVIVTVNSPNANPQLPLFPDMKIHAFPGSYRYFNQ
ncbi:MAG: PspC domain-containing protein [Candidatus Saccharimonadales bacterium]